MDVIEARIARGARVAITAGSRGIANVAGLFRGLAQAVRDAGGDPFFIAAMGSHGGAERLADARVARIKNTLHIDSMIVLQARSRRCTPATATPSWAGPTP
jgi:hypothetical protein